HNKDNIKKDVDLVVYTAAIPSDNPEILAAKDQNILLMDRAEFLGHIMKGHKYNVAVSGTHGKTTCTSMLSHVTLAANLDPTILVGGELDVIGGNFRIGNSEYFLT
ncbi:Mur ligase domain-containing protein, partial [Clostridium paraputrificum]